MADPLLSNAKDFVKTKHRKSYHYPDEIREPLWDELVRLRIRGVPKKKCAEVLGVNKDTVDSWMRHPEWKLKFAKTRGAIYGELNKSLNDKTVQQVMDIEAFVEEASHKAVKKILQIMGDKATPTSLKLKAAIDLSDRGKKTSKTKKVQSSHLHAIITPEDLAAMAQTAREIQMIGKPAEIVELNTDDVQLVEDE